MKESQMTTIVLNIPNEIEDKINEIASREEIKKEEAKSLQRPSPTLNCSGSYLS